MLNLILFLSPLVHDRVYKEYLPHYHCCLGKNKGWAIPTKGGVLLGVIAE